MTKKEALTKGLTGAVVSGLLFGKMIGKQLVKEYPNITYPWYIVIGGIIRAVVMYILVYLLLQFFFY